MQSRSEVAPQGRGRALEKAHFRPMTNGKKFWIFQCIGSAVELLDSSRILFQPGCGCRVQTSLVALGRCVESPTSYSSWQRRGRCLRIGFRSHGTQVGKRALVGLVARHRYLTQFFIFAYIEKYIFFFGVVLWLCNMSLAHNGKRTPPKINGNKKRTHEGILCTIESYNNPRPRLSTRRCPGPCHEHTFQSKTPT